MEIDEIWNKLKEGVEMVAEEICWKVQLPQKQKWMNSEILRKIEEKIKCKHMKEGEQHNKLDYEIERLCREAKGK